MLLVWCFLPLPTPHAITNTTTASHPIKCGIALILFYFKFLFSFSSWPRGRREDPLIISIRLQNDLMARMISLWFPAQVLQCFVCAFTSFYGFPEFLISTGGDSSWFQVVTRRLLNGQRDENKWQACWHAKWLLLLSMYIGVCIKILSHIVFVVCLLVDMCPSYLHLWLCHDTYQLVEMHTYGKYIVLSYSGTEHSVTSTQYTTHSHYPQVRTGFFFKSRWVSDYIFWNSFI